MALIFIYLPRVGPDYGPEAAEGRDEDGEETAGHNIDPHRGTSHQRHTEYRFFHRILHSYDIF